MTDLAKPARVTWRGATFWLGAGGAALAAIGAYGSGFGFWPFTFGFLLLAVGLLAAILTVIAAIVAWVRGRKSGGLGGRALIGLLAAIGLWSVMGFWLNKGRGAPAIHDVTTNSANPPAFQTLKLRPDNLVGVKTIENWRAIHDKAYADIQPLTLAKAPGEALGIAKRLVTERGWEIAATTQDRIEATDTVSAFRFKDDVVIVATPAADGRSTRIDMRSTSRVGIGDVGVNGARLRSLLADLKKADQETP